MSKNFKILWNNVSVSGKIETVRCKVSKINIISQGKADNCSFEVSGNNSGIIVSLDEISGGIGTNVATVTVRSEINPFTFRVGDVNSLYPIYIAEYNVIVTTEDDIREYSEIAKSIKDKKLHTAIQRIENSPEENFTNAFKDTLDISCPTWLSIARDFRIFEAGFKGMPTRTDDFTEKTEYIKTRFGFWKGNKFKDVPCEYRYVVGRGFGCANNTVRSLEDGYLPILNTKFDDGGINYSTQMFATLEKSKLIKENVRGIHYLVSETIFKGSVLTPEQEKQRNIIFEKEMDFSEEVVLYFKVTAQNNNAVPVYAWVAMPKPDESIFSGYDNQTGFGTIKNDTVFIIAAMNNEPLEQTENAFLLSPGETAEFLFLIPHSPISKERAKILAKNNYQARLDECKDFWNEKLSKAIQISLPEKRIENMMKAGFYHLDMITIGNEPDGPVAPNIGTYCAIGSESSGIVQYYDCIGRTDIAQRALDYFFVKEQDDGRMQNFMNYELENGAILWIAYLHTLYTSNIEWIKGKEEKIVKSCDYIIRWVEKNTKEEFRGKGYGMIDGQVADPVDKFHSYMLNAYACAGLFGAAKMLSQINSMHFARINAQAKELKKNILSAIDDSIADCPVVPLGNGLWCPSVSPWPESRGPVCLSTDGGYFYEYCAVSLRDSMIGSMYLLFLNVIDKNSRYADFIMNSFSELFYYRHTDFGQPFYSKHGIVNLRRGERKSFIKEFYNSMACSADDETYDFWENPFGCTLHKTHEESWFLMKCINMLYSEDMDENGNNALTVMPGVPSEWFLSGEDISVNNANTLFGELSYNLKHIEPCKKISIDVKLNLRSEKYPKVIVRVPLPDDMVIASTGAGQVIDGTNDIVISDFKGEAKLVITVNKK